jgi:hypothetical protein
MSIRPVSEAYPLFAEVMSHQRNPSTQLAVRIITMSSEGKHSSDRSTDNVSRATPNATQSDKDFSEAYIIQDVGS